MAQVAPCFARRETRLTCKDMVHGLLSELEDRNCWTLAEHAGDSSPDGMQHLLARAKWDADGVQYDERRVELSQSVLDEARKFGDMVPIVVWPDGRVEQGFEGSLGCFI